MLRLMLAIGLLGRWLAAAIQVGSTRNDLAARYGTLWAFTALYTSAPGATPGTEVSGGSPAYARRATTWAAGATGVVTASPAAHDVPSGTTIRGVGGHSTSTAGTYIDGVAVTDQAFASQGTYAVSLTYTQT